MDTKEDRKSHEVQAEVNKSGTILGNKSGTIL